MNRYFIKGLLVPALTLVSAGAAFGDLLPLPRHEPGIVNGFKRFWASFHPTKSPNDLFLLVGVLFPILMFLAFTIVYRRKSSRKSLRKIFFYAGLASAAALFFLVITILRTLR